jgi:hypothetical protein
MPSTALTGGTSAWKPRLDGLRGAGRRRGKGLSGNDVNPPTIDP